MCGLIEIVSLLLILPASTSILAPPFDHRSRADDSRLRPLHSLTNSQPPNTKPPAHRPPASTAPGLNLAHNNPSNDPKPRATLSNLTQPYATLRNLLQQQTPAPSASFPTVHATYLGAFQVRDGPRPSSSPRPSLPAAPAANDTFTYTCLEACAERFPHATILAGSTSASVVTGTCFGDGSSEGCDEAERSHDFKRGTRLDDAESWSAYGGLHGCASVNFCFAPPAPPPAL
eukprot:1190315-Prorocentrum_minimum.AAC.1